MEGGRGGVPPFWRRCLRRIYDAWREDLFEERVRDLDVYGPGLYVFVIGVFLLVLSLVALQMAGFVQNLEADVVYTNPMIPVFVVLSVAVMVAGAGLIVQQRM